MPLDDLHALLQKPSCTVAEFGRAFGLSRNSAYDAVQRGSVEAVRFGRRIVIPTAQLRRLLRLNELEGPSTEHRGDLPRRPSCPDHGSD
jgi:hypothetical protein